MAQGESLEHEDLLGQTVCLVMLDHKGLPEKLEIQDIWVHLARGDLRGPQGNQVKMEKQVNQETVVKLDSLDQQVPEDFLGLLGLLDSRVTEAMVDHLAKKVKLELLDPRVLQAPLVQWEDLDPWVLLGCQEREDALDLAA